MIEDFVLRAALGGLGVAAVAGPIGSFVVWRRMAYFGDALAHSALLGVVLGFLIGIDLNVAIVACCVGFAVLLVLLQRQRQLASDTLLGILAHASLALGLVIISAMATVRVDLLSYLLGDLLAVGTADLWWIYLGGAVILAVLAAIWRPLLALTVHEELARAEGVNVNLVRMIFMLIIALTVALSMKIVGILLVTALMIIPAAAARGLAKTPETMAVLASLAGALAVLGGLAGSFAWDLPSGPAVVIAATVILILVLIYGATKRATIQDSRSTDDRG